MAQVDETLLGKLSGSLGDIIFYHGRGKTFVCRKPRSFIPGNDRYITDLTNITSPQIGSTIIVRFITNFTSASVSANASFVELAALGNWAEIDINKAPNAKLAYVLWLTNTANVLLSRERFVAGTSEMNRAFEFWNC